MNNLKFLNYKNTSYFALNRIIGIFTLIISSLFITACSSISNHYSFGEVPENVVPITAQKEIAHKELLDVSIKLFDPGQLPEDEDDRNGLSEKIRSAEARYMPIHLKYTMQRSGYWGNVRVVPDDNEGSEVLVKGTILGSDGESLKIKIEVADASNNKWFEKIYKETVSVNEARKTESQKEDSFQDLYNKIANDIIIYRQKLTRHEIQGIKDTAEIRFAAFMAPETFKNYLQKKSEHEYQISRLPSKDDPMMKRVRSIKARDELLVDTINNYYDVYYSDMWESYENWRKFRSEELETIREIDRKALAQKALGAAAIIGAIALGASGNSDVRERTGALRTVMIAGGAYSLASGFKTSKETEINKATIEELGASFAAEVEPMFVEVKGKTMKLTGSAEQQYGKWRNLLKEVYIKETGFYE